MTFYAVMKNTFFNLTYEYKLGAYKIPFLNVPPDSFCDKREGKVPRIIWCFWTGSNELTANRVKALRSLERNSGVKVQLVTQDNLSDYVKKDYPLHPAYEYLSCVHKSDYLRAYFMRHYGGGYCDIKPISSGWIEAFEKLEKSDKICIGYSELSPRDVGYVRSYFTEKESKEINKDMFFYYSLLIGNCAYIFRANTQFSKIWMDELHRRLDLQLPILKLHPGGIWGESAGYPIEWTSILGQIFHPLSLIFNEQILHDEQIKPIFKNYR